MRRADREILDPGKIEAVLKKARVLRVAFADENRPYIVPVCFGYCSGAIFIHSADEGKKIDILRRNPHVCFEVDEESGVLGVGSPCSRGIAYRSVIGYGTALFIHDDAGKRAGLSCIVSRYAPETRGLPENLGNVCVIRIDITEMTGKKGG
ncbi:MAG: pyridoxamine 5'-phosphate oxidase family protein [Methanoregulaceae archaeon]|nr:pyridoxamine 5'-phosphate oxidase family protein [Methanoregulaceae archaeon]